MSVKVKVEGRDLRIVKAPEDIHERLERLIGKMQSKGEKITKTHLVLDLLDTHPKMKSL